MSQTLLDKHFSKMGARLKTRPLLPSPFTAPFLIDIKKDKAGEYFDIAFNPSSSQDIEVLDVDPKDRHLLLMVRRPPVRAGLPDDKTKFLCGHDERHWFAAVVPPQSRNITTAKEGLKPRAVLQALASKGVKTKLRNKRHNAAFSRQGEWFFMPEPNFAPEKNTILRNEPIRRGGNKPHLCFEVVRAGGTLVYVCSQYPNGVTPSRHAFLRTNDPKFDTYLWRTMILDATVYARGSVRHPDHATINLPFWHRVIPNTESTDSRGRGLAFLD